MFLFNDDRWEKIAPLFFLFFLFFSCSKQIEVPESIVLARVGSSIITVQDFIRRSEYTIRPDYCRQDNYIHKKIILNSLIAEKLTALENEKVNGELTDENLDAILRGRKEQAMRQVYFSKEFHSSVAISNEEIKKAYKLAGRKIKVQFLNLPDIEIVNKIKELDSQNIPLDSIYNVLWGGKAPIKEISWFDRELEDMMNDLFSENILKGQMLGPYETEEKTFILLKIIGWKNNIEITESGKKLLWEDVHDRLSENKAKKAYLFWVKDLMSGKKMNLNSEVFYPYAEKAADYYFTIDSVRRDMLNQVLWNDEEFKKTSFSLDGKDLEKNSVILDYDGDPWTVQELNDRLRSHPFVFRKRKMKRSEFPEQLRLAIADLIRDMEISKQCYLEGYDKNWSVGLNTNMWMDVYKSKKYLSGLRSKNNKIVNEQQWLEFMNPKIDSLQTIYSNQIEINMDAFEKIKLTKTDMMVIQRGVPFPIMVPSFPILTSDNKLNYGRNISE